MTPQQFESRTKTVENLIDVNQVVLASLMLVTPSRVRDPRQKARQKFIENRFYVLGI